MNSYNEVRQALDPVIGVPIKELASTLRIELPKDPGKRRGVGGHIVERLLDTARNSIPKADLEPLGTEVKTIPLNTLSRPREMTKIASFNLKITKSEPDFRRSSMFKKLRSILFVPIMKVDNTSPDFWYLRPPFLWLPTEEQLEALETDYLKIYAAAVRGDWSGTRGRFLTLNTSGSKTADKPQAEKSRAWWLTKDLTRTILEQNLWPRAGVEQQMENPTS